MAGFENDVTVCKNLNFDETSAKPHLGVINAAGKIPIGTGHTFPTPEILGGNITSPDGTLTIGYSSPNITMIANGSSLGKTITGDTGGALSPTLGNWNIFGSGSITTSGSGSTLTTQLTGLTNHSLLVGAGTSTITKVGPTSTSGQVLQSAGSSADPTFSTATYPSTTTANRILYSSATNTVSEITSANDGVLITSDTGVPSFLANGTTNQVLTATTGSPPSWQSLSSAGAITTITGNSGGAESPSSGNFNILGTGSITIAGSANTETVQLTGLTNHAVLVGSGTATITKVGPTATAGQVFQSAGSSADPTFSTSTYPSTATGTGTILRADGTNWSATTATYPNTTTLNQILYSSSANTIAGITTATNGVLITDGTTGIPNISSTLPSAVQGNITTVGTISSGTWAGTTITVNHGGTGQTTLTNHGVLVGAGTTAITQLAAGSSGQVLQSGGASADPAYSTATYPSTATSTGTILRADGTNWVATTATYPATTTANRILYSSATNTVSEITTANSSVLVTNGSGVPSLSTAIPGSTSGSVVAAGFIGEVLTSSVSSPGSSITNNSIANITSITLTAGNWMVSGSAAFIPSTGAATQIISTLSTANNTLGTNCVNETVLNASISTGSATSLPTPVSFVSVNTNTSYFLNCRGLFPNTCTAFGTIVAVRIG